VRLFRNQSGWWLESDGSCARLENFHFDWWLSINDPVAEIRKLAEASIFQPGIPEAGRPMGCQEVWGAGVTYKRSQTERIDESDFCGRAYAHIYSATRPEIFFKSNPDRCVGPGDSMKLRGDAKWSVPEPELVLLVAANKRIVGYTAGNDLSSRDIEGANLLYLPQAKIWDTSCAIGPALLLADEEVEIQRAKIVLEIVRSSQIVYRGETFVSEMNRTPEELVEWLFRDQTFRQGVFLMTGTGIVPNPEFTLHSGDEMRISITSIGTLINRIA
jgi:2-dehydro-3-deoxy-D-arabinonate dehydratase